MNNETTGHVLTSSARKPHLLLRIVLPLVFIVAALALAVFLVKTAPTPQKRPPRERISIGETQPLARTRERISLHTAGTVVPRRAVTLQPRVNGYVTAVAPHFIPGGRFRVGEVMLEVDPADYQLAVTNRLAGLVKARYDLTVEQGMQDVARNEWEAMQGLSEARTFTDSERALALREPHLGLARGNLSAAEALLAQARLDVERTRVRAPFNAVVRERMVDVGAQISVQTPLAELVDTDAYWVRATLPAGQAHWVITADEEGTLGSKAAVSSVPGIELHGVWRGSVLRKLPDLEPAGRQALLLVEVPHPDQPAEGNGTLTLGAYVRVDIEGPELDDVFSIPRRALHEETTVWLMNADNRLEIRTVDIAWCDDERALLRGGVAEGEALVLTDMNTPLNGMLLSTVAAMNEDQKANKSPRPKSDAAEGPNR